MKQVQNGKYTDFFNGNERVGYLDPRGDLFAIWQGFAECVANNVEDRDRPEELLGAWIAGKC